MIGSALRAAKQSLTLRPLGRIPDVVAARIQALLAEASDDPAETDRAAGREVFASVRSDPGNVSLACASHAEYHSRRVVPVHQTGRFTIPLGVR